MINSQSVIFSNNYFVCYLDVPGSKSAKDAENEKNQLERS